VKKMTKLTLSCLALGAVLGLWWSSLSDSKKRYFIHLGRQVPWMPFRYFA
jgi:hypothetical protein